MAPDKQETTGIITPHEHDVLSGRGNFVNYHAGNEHFRALVRKHKLEYVKCPKPQKGKFSRMIVDEIKNRNPPGRFLKQDASTKLWYDIGEKKALDKTRQALREGAPEIMKELAGDEDEVGSDGELDMRGKVRRSVRRPAHFFLDIFLQNVFFSPPHRPPTPFHCQICDIQDGFAMGNAMAGGAGFATDAMGNPFLSPGSAMGNVALQSPIVSAARNQLQISPGMVASPHMMSPGMVLSAQLSPEMQQQFSTQQLNPGRALDTRVIPAPQVHQLDPAQQQMLMNAALAGEFGDNQAGMAANMMNQQPAANHQTIAEIQMLQNKLNAIYATDQLEPRPIAAMSNDGAKQGDGNAKRMPPPSLLKRDDSLRMDKVFPGQSPLSSHAKKPASSVNGELTNSSAHLSAMSLSIGDMHDDSNLSSVFDSSLRISVASGKDAQKGPEKMPLKDKSSGNVDTGSGADSGFDMSMATIGTGGTIGTLGTGAGKFSETGNMSVATFGDPKLGGSSSNMSFSKVFEESEK